MVLLLLRAPAFVEDSPNRRANCLIRAVNTAHPATRTAFALLEFTGSPLNMVFSCLQLLNRDNPADPLVACQSRKIFPRCKCFRVRS